MADVQKKLSMPQMYLIGLVQRGEYVLTINPSVGVAVLRPRHPSGAVITITVRRAEALLNTGAFAMKGSTDTTYVYDLDPTYPKVPKVGKNKVKYGGGYFYQP